MKKTLIYFFILLLSSSCTHKIFNGFDSSGKKFMVKSDLFPLVVDTTLMYNMEISHKKVDHSGLLLVKPTENQSIRMLFTSFSGLTIFDFEFNEKEFNVIRCLDVLQKKKILDLFKKDFRALFSYNLPMEFEANVYIKDESQLGYKVKTQDGKAYFITHEMQLKKIEMPTFATSLQIDYKDYINNLPKNILITHPSLKLSIQLEQIEQ